MQSIRSIASSIRKLLLAVLLLACSAPVVSGQSTCTSTPLSKKEAEKLVLAVPDALVSKKLGGKLFLYPWHFSTPYDSYNFELRSTVSPPSAPIDNGLVGYYNVSTKTGRVLNVALAEEVGVELSKLQRTLRRKHCISSEAVQEERDDDE
jgi:hypothetical protein